MLLSTIPKAGFSQICDDGFATHLIVIVVGDVIVLGLKGLSSGILALTRNFSDALGSIQDCPDFVS
jgi:hypothetical protein